MALGAGAQGGFDKTVRVWSMENPEREARLCLAEHQLNVADLCWAGDSSRILTGSFDQTVKEWDM
eukprot:SAG11_NODE_21982_length_414_cov_1.485714_1_plen_64_part_01